MKTMDNKMPALVRWTLVASALLGSAAHGENVILFLGDGMGISTVTAARIFAGQLQGQYGEEFDLAFDKFDNVALVKTYNTDAQVPDSAGTISAILTGQKTRRGVSGISANVERGDCERALANELPTLLELAEQAGLATGVVSTARITHATPAGAYAHYADRNWESSASIPAEAVELGCKDIARQLVEFGYGDGVDVVLGGGRAEFLPREQADPEYEKQKGKRTDGRNLVDEWLAGASNRQYAWNVQELAAFNTARGQLLGLFEPSHMRYEADRGQDTSGEPSLREMTAIALQRLKQNPKGYFLLIEAGRIDHGHHASNAYRALLDTVALSQAVQLAHDEVDLDNTLILVTADHSHTLTISGYPGRGNPILGKVQNNGNFLLDRKGRPYTTLSYANGPGYVEELPDLTEIDTTERNYRQVGTVPTMIETHAGEDVAAFAQGKNASAVRGVMEQNKLFDVMRDALFGSE